MKVVLTYSHKDWNLAFFATSQLLNKTSIKGENLVLYGSRYAPEPPKQLHGVGITYIKCKDDKAVYPLGPNLMFANLMRLLSQNLIGERIFMIEPDGFPTCRDWYKKVLKAHLDTNAWCSGSFVDWVEPNHYNGNMVIEAQFARDNPCLGRPVIEAWDCHHAELIRNAGANNAEIHNAKRDLILYPTKWWEQHKQAWVHGCQNYQMWERIKREGF